MSNREDIYEKYGWMSPDGDPFCTTNYKTDVGLSDLEGIVRAMSSVSSAYQNSKKSQEEKHRIDFQNALTEAKCRATIAKKLRK